jgi:hypothetical protein
VAIRASGDIFGQAKEPLTPGITWARRSGRK